MPYPTSSDFYKTQLTAEETRRFVELSKYKDFQPLSFESRMEISKKADKYKKQLAIITEQEKPQSTEQEEKAINYWASQLADFRMKGDGEAYLLNLKEQIEAKYRSAMADVETKLQQCRANRQQKESFFAGRLQTAKDNLETIRTFKSKPRIRAEMELADAMSPIVHDDMVAEKKKEFELLSAELRARQVAWHKEALAKWEEEENEAERQREIEAEQQKAREAWAKRRAEEVASGASPPVKRGIKRVAKHIPKTYDLITPSYSYQYTISQTDEFKGITTKATFALVPWSPMSCLA